MCIIWLYYIWLWSFNKLVESFDVYCLILYQCVKYRWSAYSYVFPYMYVYNIHVFNCKTVTFHANLLILISAKSVFTCMHVHVVDKHDTVFFIYFLNTFCYFTIFKLYKIIMWIFFDTAYNHHVYRSQGNHAVGGGMVGASRPPLPDYHSATHMAHLARRKHMLQGGRSYSHDDATLQSFYQQNAQSASATDRHRQDIHDGAYLFSH